MPSTFVVQSCPPLCDPRTVAHQATYPWDFPGKNMGVGRISFSRGLSSIPQFKIFLIKKGKENKNMFIGGKWEEVLVACINVFTLVCHSTKKRNVLCVKIKSSFLAL